MKLTLIFLVAYAYTCYGASFGIDYEHDTFVMDGKPFRYIAGSVHYFRMPHQYWRDRLQKLAAAGLNAVTTYVEWSQHQPSADGLTRFDGDLNLTEFLNIAQEEGLYVILRVGPYICGERDNGGFPYWLLREKPDMQLRRNDADYKKYVEAWLDILLPKIATKYLYGNGGPIISVQVENEYGFYGACDHDYTSWLGSVFKRYIGDNAVLFTTDGSGYGSLSCGKIPDAYATVDFGPGTNVTEQIINHKAVEPRGPFVNSEFYPGWITHWGENFQRRSTESVLETLRAMMDVNANLNFYMFYGGSNLGFSAGANCCPYSSDAQSYDYDALITEAGDLTPKYMAVRELILSYTGANPPLLSNVTKGDYGQLTLKQLSRLTDVNTLKFLAGEAFPSENPLTFEELGLDQGYVLYTTTLPQSGEADLSMDPRDRAHIYKNNERVGVLHREKDDKSVRMSSSDGDQLSILLENAGRINFGNQDGEQKGLRGDVKLGDRVLKNWNHYPLQFTGERLDTIYKYCQSQSCMSTNYGPIFYTATFTADTMSNIEYNGNKLVADTFLDVTGLNKGVVFVNGYNVGRYWSTFGPQYSVYIPGAWLNPAPATNTLLILEVDRDDAELSVKFSKEPIVGDPKPL